LSAVGGATEANSQNSRTQGTASNEQIGSLLAQALELLRSSNLRDAEPLVRRAIASAPGNSDAHNLLGIILDQKGQVPAAEKEFRIALRLNPRSITTRAIRGVLLPGTGGTDEAIQLLEAVLQAPPQHPQATLNLG